MNEDILKSRWKQIRGHIREWWNVLTDDDVAMINGRRDVLIGLLQQKYGFTKEQATHELDDRLALLEHTPVMNQ